VKKIDAIFMAERSTNGVSPERHVSQWGITTAIAWQSTLVARFGGDVLMPDVQKQRSTRFDEVVTRTPLTRRTAGLRDEFFRQSLQRRSA
jgi:hypothetical protein